MDVYVCALCSMRHWHSTQNMYYTIQMRNKWISCVRTILDVNIWFKFLFQKIFSFRLACWSMVSKVDELSLLLLLLLLLLHSALQCTHTHLLFFPYFNLIFFFCSFVVSTLSPFFVFLLSSTVHTCINFVLEIVFMFVANSYASASAWVR